MKSTTRYIKIAPKKLNLVADMMRGLDVVKASAMLKFIPKKAAVLVKKSLDSAVANAVNNLKQSKENLYVHTIYATEGPKLKRFIPVSRGRAHPIIKRMSHLKIELKVKAATPAKEKAATKPIDENEQPLKPKKPHS
ncbi:50S ribosomal protein L22 [Candidatus Peregrinibacteria bacterium]|nr:50S ribosomal protein L22 [Candidatus Peregrinibacteria bacterium]